MMRPLEVLSRYPPHGGTLPGLLASRAVTEGRRPFLIFEGRSWRWDEFSLEVERTARALAARGIGPGDRLAIVAPNSDLYVLLLYALARLRAALVPVNPDLGPAEAGYVLGHSEVAVVACTARTLSVVREACAAAGIDPWLVLLDGSDEAVPGIDDLLDGPGDPDLPESVDPEDTCLIVYTSGTTGFPKGVMHAQRSFVMAGEGFVERMHLEPEDRLLCVLPLFHINALFYSLGGASAAGASLILAPRFSASRFWRLAAETGATELNIIAAVGHILARRPRSEFDSAHALTKVYGAPVSAEIAQVFREEFGVPTVIEGYGMTEVPGACNLPFEGPHRIGSMGRAARHPDPSVAFAELRVVDESGAELPDGEMGELLVRTPIVMQGYYRDPELTEAAFVDGWFRTGDLVRRDADGFFHFVARQKDIIRRRGENVSGAELDRVIGRLPGVAEVAAIAVPSDLGEDEILVAVLVESGAVLGAADVGRWCEDHLSRAKRPRFVAFVDSLPRTPTHRVAKFKLRQDASLITQAFDLQGD
jgi:crotonobetaine/carnitine-CoA ligase